MSSRPVSQCVGCQFAEWRRTKSGAMHPDQMGRCRHPFAMPANLRAALPLPLHGFLRGWNDDERTLWIVRDSNDRDVCQTRKGVGG